MQITINNLDLQYSIDTYGMFTGESVDESESEHYRETYNLTDDEWQTIGFNYDHKQIVKDLAKASVDILENDLIGNVVKSITLVPESETSPQFYNFTTDSYRAVWDIDETQLKKYLSTRHNRWVEWVLESDWNSDKRKDDPEYELCAMLDFYTINTLTVDEYNEQMWEQESDIYYQNIELDDKSRKLIDTKQPIE